MKHRATIAVGIVTMVFAGGAALAQGRHGHGKQSQPGRAEMMQPAGDMMPMMQMHRKMMGMHRNMMHGGMMDGSHMRMGGAFHLRLDADGDGRVTPEEARTQLRELLEENDSDGDGTLSIAEFEVLHSRLIRETMVDRFQHLDADGDGQVTRDEMTAPAKKIERMQEMHRMMKSAADDMPDDAMSDSE